mmetsp:Transcript_13942/g.35995  ORF Transcript_13942/g.35995 Transcript_13942/m.35995 type:complete len:1102 (+) Transcript_13942:2-3307(+)
MLAILAGWATIALLAGATGSTPLAAIANAPVRATSRLLHSACHAVHAAYQAATVFAKLTAWLIRHALIEPCLAVARVSRRRLRTISGLAALMVSAAFGLAPSHVVPSCLPPHAAPMACARGLCGAYAAMHWSRLPVRLLWRVVISHAAPCAGSLVRAVTALGCLLGGVELLACDWHIASLSTVLSAPLARMYKLVTTPPPPAVHLVRDGLCPAALAALALVQMLLADPIAEGDIWLRAGEDTAMARLVDASVSCAILYTGGRVCWLSEVAIVRISRAWLRDKARALADAARYLASHAASLAREVGVLAFRGVRVAYRGAASAALCVWHLLLLPLIRMGVAAYGHAAALARTVWRALVAVSSAMWRRFEAVVQKATRVVATAAKRLASVARRTATALFSAADSGARWLWVRALIPLGVLVRAHLLVPMGHGLEWALHRILQPLAMSAERHWPALGCGLACTSAALFVRASAASLYALAPSRMPLGGVHAPGAPSTCALLLPALSAGAAAWASASVGLMLAGYCLNSARLRRWGERGVRHVDFGAAALTDSLARAAAAAGAALVRCLGEAVASAWHWLSRLVQLGFVALYHLGVISSRILHYALSVAAALASRLILRPARLIWHSPAASLAASAFILASAYAVHRLGNWQLLASTATSLSPQLVTAAIATVRAASAALRDAAAMIAQAVPAASEPARAWLPVAAATAARGAITAAEDQMAALETAYATAGKLHAAPTYSLAIWILHVAIVRLSPALPPPRALAAVQLGVGLYFHQGLSARWLPLVAALIGSYLLGAARAERRARREHAAARNAMQQLRAQPHSTHALAQAIAHAPPPPRVFAAEDCLICLEALEPEAEISRLDATAASKVTRGGDVAAAPTSAARDSAAHTTVSALAMSSSPDVAVPVGSAGRVPRTSWQWQWPWTSTSREVYGQPRAGAAFAVPSPALVPASSPTSAPETHSGIIASQAARCTPVITATAAIASATAPSAASSTTTSAAPSTTPPRPADTRWWWPWTRQPAMAGAPAPSASCDPATCPPAALTSGLAPLRPTSTLRCGHQFHAECIARWVTTASSAVARCPACMQPIELRYAVFEIAMGVAR